MAVLIHAQEDVTESENPEPWLLPLSEWGAVDERPLRTVTSSFLLGRWGWTIDRSPIAWMLVVGEPLAGLRVTAPEGQGGQS